MSGNLTKNAIMSSLVKLLNEKPLDKITVKDIVLDCGINRNTFYYHYHDIYDLLKDIFIIETEKALELAGEKRSWQEGFLYSAQFVLKNKRAVYHVYSSSNRDELERYMYSIAGAIMTGFVRTEAEGLDASEEDIKLLASFYKHAVVGIYKEWLQNGLKGDPEEFILRIGRLLDGNIRRSLEKACGAGQ